MEGRVELGDECRRLGTGAVRRHRLHEVDRGFLVAGVQRLARIGRLLLEEARRHHLLVGLPRAQGLDRPQDGGVGRTAPLQPAGEQGHDLGDLAHEHAGPGRLVKRGVLEKDREEVRQLVRRHVEAHAAIVLQEVHHRLAPRARIAVDVTEQIEGERRRAVEERHVFALRLEELGGPEPVAERQDRLAPRRRQLGSAQNRGDLRQRLDQRVVRIEQQPGQGLARQHGPTSCPRRSARRASCACPAPTA